MRKLRTRITGMLLVPVLLLSSISFGGRALAAPDPAANVEPEEIHQAIESFTGALEKFTKDTGDLSKLETALTRFGGADSLFSGSVAILQMMGVLEDPTSKALAGIKSEIEQVETTLTNINTKLDDISSQLATLQATVDMDERKRQADSALSKWSAFEKDFRDKMYDKETEYLRLINQGIGDWWNEAQHDGIRILYTQLQDGPSVTYSKSAYADGVPDTAINGEEILKDSCIGLPAEVMPSTTGKTFSVDDWKTDLAPLYTEAFVTAADSGKLDASEAFYTEWRTLDDEKKKAKADELYNDFLDTLIYRISLTTMSTKENDKWVTSLITLYRGYASALTKSGDGISAMINYLYLTHAFEGEVKDSLSYACNSMMVDAGYLGTFVMSVLGQDSWVDEATKAEMQACWANSENTVQSYLEQSLTGYDNYCYLTNTLVNYRELQVYSQLQATYTCNSLEDSMTYVSTSASPWVIRDEDENQIDTSKVILDDNKSLLLCYYFNLQAATEDGVSSFTSYLKQNNVGIPDGFGDDSHFMTTFKGSPDFALSEGISLRSHYAYGQQIDRWDTPVWVESGKMYDINTGGYAHFDDDFFIVHDRASANLLDIGSEKILEDQTLGVKAMMEAHSWKYHNDECHFFYNNPNTEPVDDWESLSDTKEQHTKTSDLKDTVAVLGMAAVPTSGNNQNGVSFEGPLKFYWDMVGLPSFEADPVISPETDADWNGISLPILRTENEKPGDLDKRMEQEIDLALQEAKDSGLTVTLSDTERAALIEKLKAQLEESRKLLEGSSALAGTDVFGIEGNAQAEQDLADAVAGEYKGMSISPDNRITTAVYEPAAKLHFVKEGNSVKTEIRTAYEINPMLILWNSVTNTFDQMEISDAVMEQLGLTMQVRIPVEGVKAGDSVSILHYLAPKESVTKKEEKAKVQEAGSSLYAEITVDRCSLFELAAEEASDTSTPSKTPDRAQPPATGDAGVNLWLLLMLLSSAGILLTVSRKRRSKR